MANYDYYQRIFDTGVGDYVYYTKSTIDTAPLAGETTPNHTSNLVTATHEVLNRELDLASLVTGAELVWEWNGVDTTQFDISNHWTDDDASNGRITGMGMSVTANDRAANEAGNQLNIEPTGYAGGGDGSGLILALGTLTQAERVIFEAQVLDHDVNGFGFCVANDPGQSPQADLFAFCETVVGSNVTWMLEDGQGKGAGTQPPTYGNVGSPVIPTNNEGIVTHTFNLEKTTGIPRGFVHSRGVRLGTVEGTLYSNIGDTGDWPDAPPSTGWNAESLVRWGVCQYAGGASTAGPTRLGMLRVYTF